MDGRSAAGDGMMWFWSARVSDGDDNNYRQMQENAKIRAREAIEKKKKFLVSCIGTRGREEDPAS